MSGATQMQETLEKISVQKSGVDEAKGAALGTMSSAVTDIRAAVERNKEDLKPLVAELKRLRDEAASVDPRYQEMKAQYAGVAKQYELRSADALREARQLRKEVAAQESEFHALTVKAQAVDESIKRVLGGGAAVRSQIEVLQREIELKARSRWGFPRYWLRSHLRWHAADALYGVGWALCPHLHRTRWWTA